MRLKNPKKLEKITKGVANYNRIGILDILSRRPDLSLWEISKLADINFKTASEHVRRLHLADLVSKKYKGRIVQHRITNLGKYVLTFLRMLEQRKELK